MNEPVFVTSATVRALEKLVLRGGRWKRIDIPIRYGFWEHPRLGPTLIDTGYTPRATEGADRGLALKLYSALLRPRLAEPLLPRAWLRSRSVDADAVRHIVVTHFHADHIAGLRDLPKARFIASGSAFDALSSMSRRSQVDNAFFPELLPEDFCKRLIPIEELPTVALPFGLGTGFDPFGDGSCLGVPLPGHALGHFGLLWPHLETPLLYAVDTQWLLRAIVEDRLPRGPARLIYSDRRAAQESAEKVRRFASAGGRVVLCHDPDDLMKTGT
ncbi:MBL fold metallo-hydrolase [Mesorhizobium sp. LHD-90]|uniref:MBL fold metallo-hydrolase n=1 Tax=Mesorhizobium sp. LHD-90 TaxID=3071414 RepID=UPI0027E116C5|nr:MBL fold metallo-hydrolase [Mesorhizobium sp. LHD-90]MDQ6436275.1 MBL fold metallo-hydrolase [Mesorhizobium sp. LHD-90]